MRRHLSYANVVATIALIAALGGGTYAIAGDKIGAKQIAKNAIRERHIKPHNVTARDLTGVRVVSLPIPFGDKGTITCASGERLLAGGANAVGTLGESYPTNDGNGWIARANGPLTLYAVCLKKKPSK